MIGQLVFFTTESRGDRLGLIVEERPRANTVVVVYEASASTYRALSTGHVTAATFASEALRRRATRTWIKRALSRDSHASSRLKTLIRGAQHDQG